MDEEDDIIELELPPDKTVVQIAEKIANLTLIQCAQLAKYLEDVHGIKSWCGVPEVEKPPEPVKVVEKTEFDVVIQGYDTSRKINLIKYVREMTGLGLKEAKDWVESCADKVFKSGLSKADAEVLKSNLEANGASVTVV